MYVGDKMCSYSWDVYFLIDTLIISVTDAPLPSQQHLHIRNEMLSSRSMELVLIIVLITGIFQHTTAQSQDVKFVFLDARCVILHNKVKQFNCTINPTRSRSTLTASAAFNVDMSSLIGQLKIMLLQQDHRKQNLYDLRLDFCKFLSLNPRRNVLSYFYKRLRQASVNFPEKCPFKRDIPYIFKDFYVDAELIPTYMPNLNFSLVVDLFERNGKERLLTVTVDGALCTSHNYKQAYCRKMF